MRRRLLRLVAWLSAAAYLVTNTHANLLVAAMLQQPAAVCDGSSSACPHCRNETSHRECPHDTNSAPTSPASTSPDCPFESGCPCCPLGDEPCPAPGGCAMCSVAKAPCLTIVFVGDFTPLPLDEVDSELTPVYVPPVGDGLIRPPKA